MGIHTWRQGTDTFSLLNAEPEHVAIYFDISQAEVRFAAYMSKDEKMMDMYNKGIDIYVYMSKRAYPHNTDEDYHRDNRATFKSVVLGILYGRGGASIAEATGITVEEGRRLVKFVMDEFPTLAKFIENKRKYCEENEAIDTLLGDRLEADSSRAYTTGINWFIQEAASVTLAEGFFNLFYQCYKDKRYMKPKIVVHDSNTMTCHMKDFFYILEHIDIYFKKYLFDKYNVPFKYDILTFVNFRDKLDISYKDGVFELSGKEYGFEPWFNLFDKYYNYEILEDSGYKGNANDTFIDIYNRDAVSKFFTYYPDKDFKIPRKRKVKIKLLGRKSED